MWDVSFCVEQRLAGVPAGRRHGQRGVRGVPLDDGHEFAGTFLGLLNPYALLVGVTTVAHLRHARLHLSTAILLASAVATWGTLRGSGPFAAGTRTNRSCCSRRSWASRRS